MILKKETSERGYRRRKGTRGGRSDRDDWHKEKERKKERRREKRGESEQGLRKGDWSHQC